MKQSNLGKLISARFKSYLHFSQVAGCHISLVAFIATGRRRLTEKRAREWALLLGVPAKELLERAKEAQK